MADAAIRILLVDDHQVVRQGFRTMLAATPDLAVAGEAPDAATALQLLSTTHFHLVCVDIALPDVSGLDLLKTIRSRWPEQPVLVISMYSEEAYAVRAFKLGASGYLTKNTEPDVLFTAIRRAAAGRRYVTPELGERLAEELALGPARSGHDGLSEREFEVLRRIALGQGLAEIAEDLHLSAKTVTTYRARILQKLGVRSNAELVRYAVDHQIVT